MTGAVVSIVSQDAVDRLWSAYQALAMAAIERPALLADRVHCEAMARAHGQWVAAFLNVEGR